MSDHRISRNDPCPCGSGKKYKHCHGRPGAEPLPVTYASEPLVSMRQVKPEDWEQDETFRQVFLGEGLVDLTDELIEELVQEGMKREDLEYARAEGAQWHPKRKSLIFPLESSF